MDIRSLQRPLKNLYRQDPASSRITLTAQGTQADAPIACSMEAVESPPGQDLNSVSSFSSPSADFHYNASTRDEGFGRVWVRFHFLRRNLKFAAVQANNLLTRLGIRNERRYSA